MHNIVFRCFEAIVTKKIDRVAHRNSENNGVSIDVTYRERRALPKLRDLRATTESGRRVKSDCVSQLNPGELCYLLPSNLNRDLRRPGIKSPED